MEGSATTNQIPIRKPLIAIAGQLIALALISLYSYPLFHAIAEVYIVGVATAIFLLGNNSRRLVKEPYTQLLAIAFLFIGTLNMLYVLARNGTDIYPGFSAKEISTQLELATWLLLAGSLLAATFYIRRAINWQGTWIAYSILLALMLLAVFVWRIVPADYINGQPTPFNFAANGLIGVMFLAAIGRLYLQRDLLHPNILFWMILGIAAGLSTQFFLALDYDAYNRSDLLGHLLKVFSFFAFYRAIVHTAITQPLNVFLRTEQEHSTWLEAEVSRRTAELQESEQRFRRLAERLPDMIYRYRRKPTGHYTYINPAIEQIFGITAEEALRDPHVFGELMPQDTREQWVDIIRHPETFEWYEPVVSRMFHKDGREIWVEERVTPIYDEFGELSGVEGIVRDITAEKQAEEQRRRNTEETIFLHEMSVLFSSTLDADTILDHLAEKTCVLFDAYFCAVCALDESTQALDCHEYAANWDACRYSFPADRGLVGQTIRDKKTLYIPDTTATEISCADSFKESGHPAPRSVLTVPILIGKKLRAVMQLTDLKPNRFSDHDIALTESLVNTAGVALENARLYRQAVSDAQTKLTLLKEVNHRVKNNLAAIASLLYFEQRKLKGDEYAPFRQSLQDLNSRVRGLAAVHELLSSSEWQPVPLRSLCQDIVSATIRAAADQNQAAVRVTMPDISIQAEQAHHLALIINELAINSLKHGTPAEGELLKITVSGMVNDTRLTLKYHDNGSGYPAEMLNSTANGHTGFELLRNIVKRNLRGEFSVRNDDGATAEITFEPETLHPITKW